MDSSRVYIKGLPSSLGLDEFRNHFAKQSPITDAKFIPHRRIGYVGYKTHEDAKRAVKYHNKTFLRMSKINVELARSVEHQSALRRPLNESNVETVQHSESTNESDLETSIEAQNSNKRKRGNIGPDQDGKLQEFLQVMQPPSKSKIWENQDRLAVQPLPSYLAKVGQAYTEIDNEDDYEQVPKKRKTPERIQSPQSERQVTPNLPEKSLERIEGGASGAEDALQTIAIGSDADWLRSRTSRLLGLIDDGNDGGPSAPAVEISPSEMETPIRSGQPMGRQRSKAAEEKEGEAEDAEPAIVEQVHNEVAMHIAGNGRLFIRNLTYTVTEDDLRQHFESGRCGTIEEIHIPTDAYSGNNKGFAHIQFAEPADASQALLVFDQTSFQGRLMHVLPGNAKRQSAQDDFTISRLSLKKQQQANLKTEAASSTFNWNSMYMSSNAVLSSISDRLSIPKSELLDPTSSDAAVKQAHAETHIIQETKAYFASNGVDLDAFKRKERGDHAILVKNFPYGTSSDELKALFEVYGNVSKILIPPSGTIAVVGFDRVQHATSAFRALAYRKVKDSILFLEKAPKDLFQSNATAAAEENLSTAKELSPSASQSLENNEVQEHAGTFTLFVRNLNFLTSSQRLADTFRPLDGFWSARVKMKADPKKPGQQLSMGFGFVEFRSHKQAQVALGAMDRYKLDGHELLVRPSHKAIDAAEERRSADRTRKLVGKKTKIIIKNLPFEATKRDVRSLFGSYGQLKSVRLPKKLDSSTRGFAFADFSTAREAESAMNALTNTHLLGRRLVLEFVDEEVVDPEQEIEQMAQKMGKQANKVALQRAQGSGRRKKFNVEGSELET